MFVYGYLTISIEHVKAVKNIVLRHKINIMYYGAIQYNTLILPILIQYIKLYTTIFRLASFHCTVRMNYSPKTLQEDASLYLRSTTFIADVSALVYLILGFIG